MASLDLSSVTLQYFPIQGRGEPIRLLLADARIPFSESNDTATFFANKHDLAQYRFQQLPRLSVVRAGSGDEVVHLAQQGAILRFLAKAARYGEGATPWQEALVDQLQDACEDLNSAYTRCIYGQDAVSPRSRSRGMRSEVVQPARSVQRGGTHAKARRAAADVLEPRGAARAQRRTSTDPCSPSRSRLSSPSS